VLSGLPVRWPPFPAADGGWLTAATAVRSQAAGQAAAGLSGSVPIGVASTP